MDHSETSTNSSGPEPQMGQVKSSGSSSHSIAKTQLLQANFFMATTPLSLTFVTKTGESKLAGFHSAAGAAGTEFCGNRNLMHIHDRLTVVADEVNMGLRVCVEAFRTVDGGDAGDATLFFEKGQIAINCCLRDIGMLLLQHLVYHLGRGVGVRVHQAIKNRVSFAKLFGCTLHPTPPWQLFENCSYL